MRGDLVYRVYGLHEGREKAVYFGAFRSAADAEVEVAKLHARETNGRNWAEQYHNRGFVIREAVVETDFQRNSGCSKSSISHRLLRGSTRGLLLAACAQ